MSSETVFSVILRGTQGLFSVKRLFEEAIIAKNFPITWGQQKFLDGRSTHLQFSKII